MDSLDYYKIEELLTDEERVVRDRAAQFVRNEVLSEVVPCFRAAKFPDHLIARMGALLHRLSLARTSQANDLRASPSSSISNGRVVSGILVTPARFELAASTSGG